ncbi:MAG: alpha/beta family hydrolase [Limisphaerales bacterium]
MRSNPEQHAVKHGEEPERARPVSITLEDGQAVSGLVQEASNPRACYVVAHGAGAGMTHPFLAEVANGLKDRQVSVLRYQFPYMEKGSKRPDVPAVAHAAVRAAVAEAARLLPGIALFAGGKSFGVRMTAQAQAKSSMTGVRGLIFLGFPLHPPGRPSDERAQHLFEVKVPMLFLQGTRDEFADLELLRPLVNRLGSSATLKLFPEADHSFHVPKRSGRNDAEIRVEMLDAMTAWMDGVLKRQVDS